MTKPIVNISITGNVTPKGHNKRLSHFHSLGKGGGGEKYKGREGTAQTTFWVLISVRPAKSLRNEKTPTIHFVLDIVTFCLLL